VLSKIGKCIHANIGSLQELLIQGHFSPDLIAISETKLKVLEIGKMFLKVHTSNGSSTNSRGVG